MIQIRRALVLFSFIALGTCGACDGGGGAGGETHWLGDCATDADCGPGGQCICNVCTRTCNGDGDCSGLRGAACFVATSPGLAERCHGSAPADARGICLGTCKRDGDCPGNDLCLLGACVADPHDAGTDTADAGMPAVREASTPAVRDAGTSDTGPSPGQVAKGYVHVDAGGSFGEPVAPPRPFTDIEGTDVLAGTWEEREADGSPCIPELAASKAHLGNDAACPRLEITRAANGSLTGRITWAYDTATVPPPVSFSHGPYAPPTDPAKGYPEGVTPEAYPYLQRISPNVAYTVFDGAFDGANLTFWVSPMDLWTDWCAMQAPYPIEVQGVKGYRCVPSNATDRNTDPGKLALCSQTLDLGHCTNASGSEDVCRCPPDAGFACTADNACACTAAGCASDLRRTTLRFVLALNEKSLRGFIRQGQDTFWDPVELVKVSP
jgi:hypothetical protein